MDRAKHLPRSYNLKLEHVAERCRYRDTTYLCRVFKQLTKMKPGEYGAQRKPQPKERGTPGRSSATASHAFGTDGIQPSFHLLRPGVPRSKKSSRSDTK